MSKYFDIFAYLMGKKAGGGGGGDITVESKSISSNGTYTAPAGKAYSPVSVSVPNSYAAGDEGKVVSNGALVAQGSDTVTQNGTVDTTLINSLLVNVSGGGGGSNWTLLASQEFSVNTSSTSETSVGSIQLDLSDYNDPNTVLWVHIRDKAGKRTGYLYGSDTVFLHWQLANNNPNSLNVKPAIGFGVTSEDMYNASVTTSCVGVYASRLYYSSSNHSVQIVSKYNSTYGTINGTFKCDVYKLTMPSGVTLFETS